eukprot:6476375-Amphidinium_carterae.1
MIPTPVVLNDLGLKASNYQKRPINHKKPTNLAWHVDTRRERIISHIGKHHSSMANKHCRSRSKARNYYKICSNTAARVECSQTT